MNNNIKQELKVELKQEIKQEMVGGEDKKEKKRRVQVSKACSNCRKIHAACDKERPCHRCKNNKMEDTCIDVPRKKRVKKSTSNVTTDENGKVIVSTKIESMNVSNLLTSSSSNTPNNNNANFHFEDMNNDLPLVDLFSPNFNPDPMMITEFSILDTYQPQQQMQNIIHQTLQPPPQMDISYLVQQVQELKQHNKTMESRLMNLTDELFKLREKVSNTRPEIQSWTNIASQQDLGVSVWKNTSNGKFGCGATNVLVECNDKFIEMSGYPIEELKNNFTCVKLIKGSVEKIPGTMNSEWPKKTQLLSSDGVLRECYITITPVTDNNSTIKFYIMHTLLKR